MMWSHYLSNYSFTSEYCVSLFSIRIFLADNITHEFGFLVYYNFGSVVALFGCSIVPSIFNLRPIISKR
jgi:hypothetical protein